MKLYNLIRQFKFKDVFKYIKEIDKKSQYRAYLSAWKELLTLEPIESDYGKGFIEIEEVIEEEGENWINILGFYPEQVGKTMFDGSLKHNGYYGLEFTDWREWLGLEIKNETKLDDIRILANILWEMTYSGYSNKDIMDKRGKLVEIAEKIKEERK